MQSVKQESYDLWKTRNKVFLTGLNHIGTPTRHAIILGCKNEKKSDLKMNGLQHYCIDNVGCIWDGFEFITHSMFGLNQNQKITLFKATINLMNFKTRDK